MSEKFTQEKYNRAVLVGLNAHCLSAEENADDTSMEELADLLETAGGVCVGTVFQNKDAPDPRTFIGEGKVAEVKQLVDAIKGVKSPYNVNALSQKLGAAVLRHPQTMKEALAEILASREQLLQGIRALGEAFPGRFVLLPCATNFATLRMADGEALYHYLGEQGISIRYTGGLVRITCGTAGENRAVLTKMADYFAAVPAKGE